MSIEVRKAQSADANEVYRLLQQFVVSYQPERAKFDDQFPRLMASEEACFLVADIEGICGYALALRVPTLYANGDLWELQELMVAPERRTQGVGAELLKAVISHARAEGAVEVVVPSRRAGGYYLRHGFTEAASYYKLRLNASEGVNSSR